MKNTRNPFIYQNKKKITPKRVLSHGAIGTEGMNGLRGEVVEDFARGEYF